MSLWFTTEESAYHLALYRLKSGQKINQESPSWGMSVQLHAPAVLQPVTTRRENGKAFRQALMWQRRETRNFVPAGIESWFSNPQPAISLTSVSWLTLEHLSPKQSIFILTEVSPPIWTSTAFFVVYIVCTVCKAHLASFWSVFTKLQFLPVPCKS